MAHYIGKFDTDAQIQQALDQGNLVKPYVAQYGNENDGIYLDYNSKTATASGSTSLPSAETISYSYYGFYVDIYASNLYWSITTPEWVGAAQYEGYGDANIEMSVGENESEDSRTGVVTFTFYYDSERSTVRNVVTYTLTQNGHAIVDGYAEPSGFTLSSGWTQQTFTVYGDSLYWNMSGDPWISFNWGTQGQGVQTKLITVGENYAGDRSGNVYIDFYTDYEKTQLKNRFVMSVDQAGQGNTMPSFNQDYYVESMNVSSASGSTNVYIINNETNQYYTTCVLQNHGSQVSGDPTTVFTIDYPQTDEYSSRQLTIEVNFYADSEYQSYITTRYLYINQAGDTSLSKIEWEDAWSVYDASGGNENVNITLGSTAAYWKLEIPTGGIESFTDYPGVYELTGDSNTNVVGVSAAANPNYGLRSVTVTGSFYDSNDQQIGQAMTITKDQDMKSPGEAVFNESGSEWAQVEASWTGDVVVNYTVESGIYFGLYDGNGQFIASGDTSGSVTGMTISDPNTGSSQNNFSFIARFSDVSDFSNILKETNLTFVQNYEYSGPAVHAVWTFITTADNQTVLCNNADPGAWSGDHGGQAQVDGGNWVNVSNGQYTFASAGTHTLHYVRQSDDVTMQLWYQNTDAVSMEGYSENSANGWGFHDWEDTFANNPNLTAVTFDDTLVQIGTGVFNGCTALTSISIYGTQNIYIGTNNGQTFETIDQNTGTLHVPVGSSSNFQNFIDALGSNWTLVDDLVIS